MGRFIIIASLIFVGYLVAKRYFHLLAGKMNRNDSADNDATELVQDPQCGTYFARQQGVEARIDGQTVYFCSEACRGKYLEKHRSG